MANNVSSEPDNDSRAKRARRNAVADTARDAAIRELDRANERIEEYNARDAMAAAARAADEAREAQANADLLHENAAQLVAEAAAAAVQANNLVPEEDDISVGRLYFEDNALWLETSLGLVLQAKWDEEAYTTLLQNKHLWTLHPMQTYMVGKAALNNGNGNDSYIVAGLERASNWTGLILSRAWEAGRVPPIERYFANQHDQMDLANNVFLMLHVGASSSGHYILLHYQRDAHVGRVIQATPCPEVTEALGAQNLLFNAVFGEISRLAPNFLTIVHVKIDVVGADKKDYACCGPLAVCALKHFLRFPRSSEKTLVVQQCRKTAIISLKNVLRDCFSKGIILEDTEAEEDEEIILEDTEAEEDELANTKLLCYLDDADFLEEIEQLH